MHNLALISKVYNCKKKKKNPANLPIAISVNLGFKYSHSVCLNLLLCTLETVTLCRALVQFKVRTHVTYIA